MLSERRQRFFECIIWHKMASGFGMTYFIVIICYCTLVTHRNYCEQYFTYSYSAISSCYKLLYVKYTAVSLKVEVFK